jgi:hypothetical protein
MAWVSHSVLFAATLSASGLSATVSSPVPVGSFAATWIGARVVIGQPDGTDCCGYTPNRFDVWDPTDGAFVPGWTTDLAFIYGPVPAGATPLANVDGSPQARGCLARVNGVTSVSIVDKVCPPGLNYESTMGLLAPDGAHLVELQSDTERSLMVIDTSTRAVVGSCLGNEPIAFEDSSHVLIYNTVGQQLVRCDIDTGTTVALPNAPSLNDYRFVPRYGV